MGYFNRGVASPESFQENAYAGQYNDPVSQETLDPNYGIQESAYSGTEGDEGIIDMAALVETMLVDAICQMPDAQRKAYLESQELQDLCEAGIVGHRSITRLNKQDDFTRRLHLAALQKAKENGDANWEALRKNRIQERKLREAIFARYASAVRRDAQQAQKRLLRISPKAFDTLKDIR